MVFALMFPALNPVAFQVGPFTLAETILGPFSVRWYALAYIAGLLIGWFWASYLLSCKALWKNQEPIITKAQLEDLISWVALGVILGGRLGYVLFYKPAEYFANPAKIFQVWEGGMSFHGGFLGVMLALFSFSRVKKISFLSVSDLVAAVVPIGLFLGRIANFINAELYGRVTTMPWGVIFPDHTTFGGVTEPRHPSQLYEAFAEGIVLFIVLKWFILHRNAFFKRGRLTAIFLMGYGVARIICEAFREPDWFLGYWLTLGPSGVTQGMILSIPMILIGIWLWIFSSRPEIISLSSVKEGRK
jgi:phosphatidylglycerol---prolipoprotein diacylglyceryl transferase